MKIREAEIVDAEGLANLIQRVDESSEYMLWEAGERHVSADSQLKMIKGMKSKENSCLLVAEENKQLVGYMLVVGGNATRNKHSAYLVIGILKDFRGKGIGTRMFNALEQWSALHHIKRLELTVATKNNAALSLYKKAGFEVEGTKRNSLFVNNEFVDEYYMSKLL